MNAGTGSEFLNQATLATIITFYCFAMQRCFKIRGERIRAERILAAFDKMLNETDTFNALGGDFHHRGTRAVRYCQELLAYEDYKALTACAQEWIDHMKVALFEANLPRLTLSQWEDM